MICPLCSATVKKFAKSHLIPDAITQSLRNTTEPLAAVSPGPHENTWDAVKKNYGGIHARIVCLACEHEHFSAADNCIVPFWRTLPGRVVDFELPILADGLRTFKVRDHKVSPDLVHRFAIQTLLRFDFAYAINGDKKFRLPNSIRAEFIEMVKSKESTLNSKWYVSVDHTHHPLGNAIVSPHLMQSDPFICTFALPNTNFIIAENFEAIHPDLHVLGLTKGDRTRVFHKRRMFDGEKSRITEVVLPHIESMGRVLGRR